MQKANLFSVGIQSNTGTYPTLYLYGKANNDTNLGFYKSINKGLNWIKINDESENELWGSIKVIAADMNVPERYYIGISGQGVIVGQPQDFTLAIKDLISTDNSFIIYPNPSNGIIYISDENKAYKSISIYNFVGELMSFQTHKGNSINISHLPKGTYILNLETEEGTLKTQKIILQ